MFSICFVGRPAPPRPILDIRMSRDQERTPPVAAGSIDRRVARTRRLLQQALFRLAAEKGYGTVTVEDICREADVGRSTFYTHYTGKDCLRKATIGEHLNAIRARGDVRHSQRNTRRFAFSGPAFAHADATREMHRALTGGKKHEMPEEIRDWISGRVRRELTDMAVGNAGRARLEVVTRFVVGAFFEVMHWLAGRGDEAFSSRTRSNVRATCFRRGE